MYDQHACGIDPEILEAAGIRLASLKSGEILPHPQEPFAFRGHTPCERQRETGRRGFFTNAGCEYLMQAIAIEAATERLVGGGMAQPNLLLTSGTVEGRLNHKGL
jgi:hypothetical protein